MRPGRIEEIKRLCEEYKEGEENIPPRITEGNWERFENYVVKSDWTPPLAFGADAKWRSAYFIECSRKIDAEFCAQAKGIIRELLTEFEMVKSNAAGRHPPGCTCLLCGTIRELENETTRMKAEIERWKKKAEEWESIATRGIEMFDQVMDILDPR